MILIKKIIIFLIFLTFTPSALHSKPKNTTLKTKFYNFDDLLIKGEYKKPQILYIDQKQKVKFEKLLKLKKNFLNNLKNTSKDPSLN